MFVQQNRTALDIDELSLQVAGRVAVTVAEGPYRRFAVWVQGCTLACPGCCNPEMWSSTGGQQVAVSELVAEVEQARVEHQIEGVTVLGGEPCEQLSAVTKFVHAIKSRGLGVIVFSGYRHSEIVSHTGGRELLASVDTLVDGRYIRDQPERGRRFIGSRNQTLHHRTPRYDEPSLWRGPAQVEVQISSTGTISVHGAPALTRQFLRRIRERS